MALPVLWIKSCVEYDPNKYHKVLYIYASQSISMGERYIPTVTSHYLVVSRILTCGYMERAAMCHVVWLHVQHPCPTWSCRLMFVHT